MDSLNHIDIIHFANQKLVLPYITTIAIFRKNSLEYFSVVQDNFYIHSTILASTSAFTDFTFRKYH